MKKQPDTRAPQLPVLKGCCPFRLGTTSFVLPDQRLANAHFLAPLLDEVELLFFESRQPDSLPDAQEIHELAALGRDQNLRYNVHLPLDLFLGDADNAVRSHGLEAAKRFIARTAALDPTCWVLHLDWLRPDGSAQHDTQAWLDRLHRALSEILATGVRSTSLVVENLMYPLDLLKELVTGLDLRFCLDIGHMLLSEPDPEAFFQRYLPDTTMLHVHGVRNGKDHVSLAHLEAGPARMLRTALRDYSGGVSLEIFNLKDLASSLERLVEWNLCPEPQNRPSS